LRGRHRAQRVRPPVLRLDVYGQQKKQSRRQRTEEEKTLCHSALHSPQMAPFQEILCLQTTLGKVSKVHLEPIRASRLGFRDAAPDMAYNVAILQA
jgi:hypothetical protein